MSNGIIKLINVVKNIASDVKESDSNRLVEFYANIQKI
jgi:hypothetical protein